MSVGIDPRWVSMAELAFGVKLSIWLAAIWIGLWAAGRWSHGTRQRVFKLSLIMLFGAILLHSAAVTWGIGFGAGFHSWPSTTHFDLRFSSLESPERVPPSLGYFQRWEEGSVWRDPIDVPWQPGRLQLWLSGAGLACYCLQFCGGLWERNQRLRSCRRASGTLQQTVRSLAATLRCRRVPELWLEPGNASPFCCGFLKPVIVMGEDWVDTVTTVDLEAIIAHELAHVRSRDLWWRESVRCLQSAFWFHPLVWPLAKRYEAHAEALSDRAAVNCTRDTAGYSRLLARIALATRRGAEPGGGFAMARVAGVRRRIEALQTNALPESPVASRSGWLVGLSGVLLMALTVAWGTNCISLADQVQWRLQRTLELPADGVGEVDRGDSPSEAIPPLAQLIPQLSAENWRARQSAGILIAQLGAAGSRAHAALVGALSDREWQVRQSAAYALMAIGVRQSATASLIECLEDPEWHVRKPAVLALAQHAVEDPQTLDALLSLSTDPEWHVRLAVVRVLEQMPSLTPHALGALGQLESDVEPRVRRAGMRLSQKHVQGRVVRG